MSADFESRLAAIEGRNARVEQDKAWETSWFRRGLVAGVTYICATLLLMTLQNNQPWLGALVPVAGYLISTLSLPFAKSVWIERFNRRL